MKIINSILLTFATFIIFSFLNSTFNVPNSFNGHAFASPAATPASPTATPSASPSASATASIAGGMYDSTITKPTGLPDVFTDASKTISFFVNLLIGIAGAVFIIMLLYGGIMYLTSAGTETGEKAKKSLLSAVIGIIVVAISWVVAYFILKKLNLTSIVFADSLLKLI